MSIIAIGTAPSLSDMNLPFIGSGGSRPTARSNNLEGWYKKIFKNGFKNECLTMRDCWRTDIRKFSHWWSPLGRFISGSLISGNFLTFVLQVTTSNRTAVRQRQHPLIRPMHDRTSMHDRIHRVNVHYYHRFMVALLFGIQGIVLKMDAESAES